METYIRSLAFSGSYGLYGALLKAMSAHTLMSLGMARQLTRPETAPAPTAYLVVLDQGQGTIPRLPVLPSSPHSPQRHPPGHDTVGAGQISHQGKGVPTAQERHIGGRLLELAKGLDIAAYFHRDDALAGLQQWQHLLLQVEVALVGLIVNHHG